MVQHRGVRHTISIPFIWAVLFPIVIADIFVEIYHRICFPLYGLPYVPREQYIKIDRHRLSYLTYSEKVFCAYCGYVNGWFGYASQIAGKTESYWCGIQHKPYDGFVAPAHHTTFAVYDDEAAFDAQYPTPSKPN